MTVRADHFFPCMGTTCRVLAEHADPVAAERFLHAAAARLTRFDAASELARLNADPRPHVPASPLLRAAVRAALWAADRSGGLVDPCLADDLAAHGYATSRAGLDPASLADALRDAPPRRAARPRHAARWRDVTADHGAITRPPGLRLDLGGTAKGLLADAAVHRLGGDGLVVVDAGGDVRVAGGTIDVDVANPFGGIAATLIVDGAVATSGIGTRLWRRPDGTPAHHLVDPSTGAPAWTGLVQVTVAAPTALQAETLAKTALLAGPERARDVVAGHQAVLVHDDGEVLEVDGDVAAVGA